MISLTAIQRADQWRGKLPDRVHAIAQLLRLARERGCIAEACILDALDAAEEGMRALAREALDSRSVGALYEWVEWARRVFRRADFTVSTCVAVRASTNLTVLGDLHLVAFELGHLGDEARDLGRMLIRHPLRGAA